MKKKILFFYNSDISKFGVSKKIQEKYDADYYGLIDITDKPKSFFETQKIVKFEKIWFYHDHIHSNKKFDEDFLKEFEQKYSLNLWNLIYSERIFHNFNEFYNFRRDELLSIFRMCVF